MAVEAPLYPSTPNSGARTTQKPHVLGFVGPPGVGKQYSMEAILEHHPDARLLPIVTTRPRRPTDGLDRISGVAPARFLGLRDQGKIVLDHQPFGSHYYGYFRKHLETRSDGLVLVEPHVDHTLVPMQRWLGGRLYAVGLIAGEEYLRSNLRQRGESEEEIRTRIPYALQQVEAIFRLYHENVIDELVELSPQNRDELRPRVVSIAAKVAKMGHPRDIRIDILGKSIVKS